MTYEDLTVQEKKQCRHFYWRYVVMFAISPRNVEKRLKNSTLPTNTDEAAYIYLFAKHMQNKI